LDQLARHRRAAIAGCAGSGKTVLAFEKARRLSEAGYTVLLTCFNKTLAGHLRTEMQVGPRLHLHHFHGLCAEMVKKAGLEPTVGESYVEWLPQGCSNRLL
jgi:predicted ATPase